MFPRRHQAVKISDKMLEGLAELQLPFEFGFAALRAAAVVKHMRAITENMM